MADVWAGIDAGKREHHCVAIDETGTVLLSKRIENDEDTLLALMSEVSDLAAGGSLTWATDLTAHKQQVLYIPGHIIHHAAAT